MTSIRAKMSVFSPKANNHYILCVPKIPFRFRTTVNIDINYNARKTLEKFSACPTYSKT